MVASQSVTSFLPLRPTSRTLGALFAGSAVMFTVAVVHGDPTLTASDEPQAETLPQTSDAATAWSAVGAASSGIGRTSSAAVVPADQATPWTPGATPDWATPLGGLPIHRAPVQGRPQQFAADPDAVPAAEEGHDFGTRNEETGQDDEGVLDNVLGYFVKGFGL